MANSSNHELEYSMPEMIFHDWTDGNRKDESLIKCPLCNNFAKSFYCADCVRNGNFTHSKKKCFERGFMFSHLLSRFADKKPKKYKLEEEKLNILKRYENALAKKIEIENVKFNINSCKEKISILQKNINISRNEILKGNKIIKKLEERKKALRNFQENMSEKIRKRRDAQKLENAKLSIKEAELNSKQCALQSVINNRVKELVTHIFPIMKISPQQYREEGQFAELEEAQKTTYIQGQWVIAGSPLDRMEYRIVDPCIPSTGDYSAYPAWCAAFEKFKSGGDVRIISTENLSPADKRLFDIAYGISGSLSYAAHIVNILAFYMDVHLPKRSNMNDFYRDEYVEKFYHNVAKLNANIINLCLSQNVDISVLSAHRTISNLLLLINSKKYESKRYLTLEEQEEILESLEDSIFKDIPVFEESDDNSEAEFVHVSDEDILEVPEFVPISVSNLISLCANDSSEAEFVHISNEDLFAVPEFEPPPKPPESLYSSVVSLWKGFAGGK